MSSQLACITAICQPFRAFMHISIKVNGLGSIFGSWERDSEEAGGAQGFGIEASYEVSACQRCRERGGFAVAGS